MNDRINYASAGAVRQRETSGDLDHIHDLAYNLGRAIATIEILLNDLEKTEIPYSFIKGDIERAKELVEGLKNK